MFRYLPAILLVQAVTLVLFLLAPPDLQGINMLRLLIPVVVVGFIAAFWFNSMAEHRRKDELARAREAFAREREHIKVKAERAKARVVKQAQQDIAKEARSTHAKANFKVGAAFAGVAGAGALLLLTQFLTVGIILLATAGGGLGGYLLRARQQNVLGKKDNVRVIKGEESKRSLPGK